MVMMRRRMHSDIFSHIVLNQKNINSRLAEFSPGDVEKFDINRRRTMTIGSASKKRRCYCISDGRWNVTGIGGNAAVPEHFGDLGRTSNDQIVGP